MTDVDLLYEQRAKKFAALKAWWNGVHEAARSSGKGVSKANQKLFDEKMDELAVIGARIADAEMAGRAEGRIQEYERIMSRPYTEAERYDIHEMSDASRWGGGTASSSEAWHAPQSQGPTMIDDRGNRMRLLSGGEKLLSDSRIPNPVGHYIVGLCKKQRNIRLNEFEEFSLRVADDTSGGLAIGTVIQLGIIDLARNASVAIAAGVRTLPMQAENVRLLKADTDWSAQWLPEAAKATASDLGVGALELQSRTLRIHQLISEEAILDRVDAALTIETLLRRSLGTALDKAVLIGGQDGDVVSPTGLEILDGVKVQAAVGTPVNYNDFSTAFHTVKQNNAPPEEPVSVITSARTAKTLDQLQDTTNQPMSPPESWRAMQKFTTEAIPDTRGAGGDESIAFVGPFGTAILGIRLDASVFVREVADQTFTREIIGALRADFGVPRPEFFVRLTGITA